MSQELFESIVDQVVEVGGEAGRRVPLELQRADDRSALRGARPRPLRAGPAGQPPDQRLALRPGPRRAPRGGWVGSATSASTCRRSIPSGTTSCTARRTSTACSRNVDALRARALAEEIGDRRARRRGRGAPARRRGDPGALRAPGLEDPAVQDPQPPGERHLRARSPRPKKKLRGCELMGSRPFEHLHVTATAKAVLCCQDYYEKLTVGRPEDADGRGDPRRRHDGAPAQAGPTASRKRPADFLCRRCEFALGE